MTIYTENSLFPDLEPYSGDLRRSQIVHLLKRLMFGAKLEDINYFESKPLKLVMEEIMRIQPEPSPPINDYNTDDFTDVTGVKLGDTWINNPVSDSKINLKRKTSFKSWWIQQMYYQKRSIHEKMILFWHNHFVVEADTVKNPHYLYQYHSLLRKHALGNFKQFVKDITLSPAMLLYLNGNKNVKAAPDENYARELQELFTIGKGPGSKFTEEDVQAIAKILTGYTVSSSNVSYYSFLERKHDTSDKILSSFYKNITIKGRTGTDGEKELDALIDALFETEELSKFICRKIYLFFVHHDLNKDVEEKIITPLAGIFRKHDYEIIPVLTTLFSSNHFFNPRLHGTIIKSPIDFIIGSLREFQVIIPEINSQKVEISQLFTELVRYGTKMEQNIADPPSVAGWPAYYQEPLFYKAWINTDTFQVRMKFIDSIIKGISYKSSKLKLDFTEFAKTLSNPENPDLLISDSLSILYKVPLSRKLLVKIKNETLLEGNDESSWTKSWKTRESNVASSIFVKNKLSMLYRYLLTLPEYQLS